MKDILIEFGFLCFSQCDMVWHIVDHPQHRWNIIVLCCISLTLIFYLKMGLWVALIRNQKRNYRFNIQFDSLKYGYWLSNQKVQFVFSTLYAFGLDEILPNCTIHIYAFGPCGFFLFRIQIFSLSIFIGWLLTPFRTIYVAYCVRAMLAISIVNFWFNRPINSVFFFALSYIWNCDEIQWFAAIVFHIINFNTIKLDGFVKLECIYAICYMT